MKSQTFTDLYHFENNVYCNDATLICRLHKLIIVYFKCQNIFSFFILKKLKDSNVTYALMTLINSETPEQSLNALIGEKTPDPLSCNVENYEVALTPNCLGNFEMVVTYEPLDSLMASGNKACIVFLDTCANINPVDIFKLICSEATPNTYAKTSLVPVLANAFDLLPSQTIILMSLETLWENIEFLQNGKTFITIHLLHCDAIFKPNYPAMNFTVVYLEKDKQLAEPVLPTIDSNQPYYAIKKLVTLAGFFS